MPYNDRGRYLADADIGVSTHVLHVETAFSFRTRMLDYLWAGMPVVCTEGDEFAGIVAREGLGRVVAEGDRFGLAVALRELLSDPVELARCRAAAAVVADRFRWPTALAPLVAYCAAPWRAPDADPAQRPVGPGSSSFGSRLTVRIQAIRQTVHTRGWRGAIVFWGMRSAQTGLRPVLLPIWRRLPSTAKDRVRQLRG